MTAGGPQMFRRGIAVAVTAAMVMSAQSWPVVTPAAVAAVAVAPGGPPPPRAVPPRGAPVPVDPLPSQPAPEVTPTDYANVPPPRVVTGFDAKTSVEDVSARARYAADYRNSDGTHTRLMTRDAINYQVGKTWAKIDNHLIADPARPGVVKNTANDWTVGFGKLATSGVDVAYTEGHLAWTAAGVADVAPVIEGDGTQVRYVDAWPGVDLVYLVHGDGVDEQIVIKTAAAAATFDFTVDGADLARDRNGRGFAVGGPLAARSLRLSEPVVSNGKGVLVDEGSKPAAAAAVDPVLTAQRKRPVSKLSVGVDPAWLKTVPADQFPIVIDPTTTPFSVNTLAAYTLPTVTTTQDGFAYVGNPNNLGAPAQRWRSVVLFDYSSLFGKHIIGSKMQLTPNTGSGTWGLRAFWATEWGPHTVARPCMYPATFPCSNPDSNFASPYMNIAVNAQGGTQTFDDTTGTAGLTGLYDYFTTNSLVGSALLLTGDETPSTYTFQKLGSLQLSLTYNNSPSVPNTVAGTNPPDQTTVAHRPTSFQLANPGADPDGDPLTYQVQLSLTSDFVSGLIYAGPFTQYLGGAVGYGGAWTEMLTPGLTYYWRVVAFDGLATTPSAGQRFTYQPRYGSSNVSPMDGLGPVAVNLATGNVSTSVDSPSFSALGGAIGAHLEYNSSLVRQVGLSVRYYIDTNQNLVIDDTSDAQLVNSTESTIDHAWSGLGVAPGVSTWFRAKWSGTLSAAAGTYQLGVMCDRQARITLNNVTAPAYLDKWAGCSGSGTIDWGTGTVSGQQLIRVDYEQQTGAGIMRLYVRGTGATVLAPQIVDSSWLTPTAQIVPSGWTLTHGAGVGLAYQRVELSALQAVLVAPDGDTTTFTRTATTSAWTSSEGLQTTMVSDASGGVTVHDQDGTVYTFLASGTLGTVAAPVDDRGKAASVAYNYDPQSGRVTEVYDPVSQRGLHFHYKGDSDPVDCSSTAPDGTTPTTPPSGMLCEIFFRPNYTQSANQQLWSSLIYTSGKLTGFWNLGSAALSHTDFGYDGFGFLSTLRTPTANDALRTGQRGDTLAPPAAPYPGDTAETRYDIGYATFGYNAGSFGWQLATTVTGPAPAIHAARPQRSYNYTWNAATGSSTTTSVTVAGGASRSVTSDGAAHATASRDALNRQSTTTWDSKDRVVSTTDLAGRKTTNVYDPNTGWLTDSYGPWTPATAVDTCVSGGACVGVPHQHTNYDEGLNGLAVDYWTNNTLNGSVGLRAFTNAPVSYVWGAGGPSGLTSTTVFSGRYTGEVVIPSGLTQFQVTATGGSAGVWLDDAQVVPLTAGGGTSGTLSLAAASVHKIRVDFVKTSGATNAGVELRYVISGGSSAVLPAANLHPRYGLVTSTRTDEDPATPGAPPQLTSTSYGANPEYGLAVSTTTGSGTTALTTSTGYETAGTGWRRMTSRTLPGANSWSYTYYGDTETVTGACGTSSTVQSGMLHTRKGPANADGKPRIEEFVYDLYGRQIGRRVGLEGTTPGQLDASVLWTCTTFDARFRPATTSIPLGLDQATARTVTYNYNEGGKAPYDTAAGAYGDVLTSSVADNNVAGSTNGGKVTTRTDLNGFTTSYTDVWGNVTTSVADQAQRLISRTGPFGNQTYSYNTVGQLATQGLGSPASTMATPTYNATSGELSSVAYGNGTTGTVTLDPNTGRTSTLAFTKAAASITTDTVARSRSGRVVTDTDPNGTSSYVYDTAGRLRAAKAPGHEYDYRYAAIGGCGSNALAGANSNRTSMVDLTTATGTQAQTAYCYDQADRLLTNATPATTYPTRVLADNPAAYWRLNETTGTTAADASPNAKTGTYTGTPTLNQTGAPIGSATTSVNTASGYVNAPAALLQSSTTKTIEAWFNTTSTGVIAGMAGAGTPGGAVPTGGSVPVLYVGTDGKLRGEFWMGLTTPITTTETVNDGAWHHVALVGAATTQTMYLDGAIVGTLPGTINQLTMTANWIGTGYNSSVSWPAGFAGWAPFQGRLDEVAIYNTALTPAQIAAHVTPSPSGGTTTAVSKTFETAANTDNMVAWYGDTVAQTTAQAHAGTGSLAINPTASSWGVEDNWGGTLPVVVANTTYTVSAWAKAATASASLTLAVQWVGGAGTLSTVGTVTDTTTGWTQITGTVTAPAGATNAVFEVTSANGAATQIHYVDDITMTTGTVAATIGYDPHGNTQTMAGETLKYDNSDRHIASSAGTTTVTYTRDALNRIVARTAGGVTTKYGFDGTSDNPAGTATVNAGNTTTETYAGYPAGVLLTRRIASSGGSTTVMNKTFETPPPDTNGMVNWYGETITQTTTQAHTGTGSLAVLTDAASGQFWGVSDGWNTQPVTGNTTYTFSLWAKAGTGTAGLELDVQWVNGTTNPVTVLATGTDTTTGWTQLTATATAPSDATAAVVEISSGTSSNNQTHYLDDITITTGSGGTQTTTDTWSYPNIHGDITRTADNTGTPTGTVATYDPYGNQLVGSQPDNTATNLDYTWLGQEQRPIDHETGLLALVEMGARPYSPTLGRFLEVDPVEGGTTTNDYAYVPDPLNQFDISGQFCKWCKKAARFVNKHRAAILQAAAVGAFVLAAVASGGASTLLAPELASTFMASGVALDAAAGALDGPKKGWAGRAAKAAAFDLLPAFVTGGMARAMGVPTPVQWLLGNAATALSNVIRPVGRWLVS